MTASVRSALTALFFSVEYPPDTSHGCSPCPPPGPRILEREFRASDVGTRITADRRSDPDFAAFARLLGNNRADELEILYEVREGSFDFSAFGRVVSDTELFPIDLSSYRITGVSFLLTEFAFDTSNPQQIFGQTYFQQRLRGTFEILGEVAPVPEPATLTLLGIGLVATGWHARRRRALHKSPRPGDSDGESV